MANKIKRFLSMALTVFMIMTMMPATVLATEGEQPIVVIETEPEVPANGDTPDAEIEGEEEPTEDGENSGDQHLCESYTEETLAAVDPTCTETGLTEGKKCSACGEVLVAQEVIEAAGHSFTDGACTACGEIEVIEEPEEAAYAAYIGEAGFDTLADALAEAEEGAEIVLKASVEEDIVIAKPVSIKGAEGDEKVVLNGNIVIDNSAYTDVEFKVEIKNIKIASYETALTIDGKAFTSANAAYIVELKDVNINENKGAEEAAIVVNAPEVELSVSGHIFADVAFDLNGNNVALTNEAELGREGGVSGLEVQNPGAEVPGAGDEQPENNNVIVVTVNGTMTVGDSAPVYEEVITGELQEGHWVEVAQFVRDAEGNIMDYSQLAAGEYVLDIDVRIKKSVAGNEMEVAADTYTVQASGVLTVKASEPSEEPTEEPVETPTPAPSAEPTPAPEAGDVVDPTPTEVPSATEAPAIPGGVQGDEDEDTPGADEVCEHEYYTNSYRVIDEKIAFVDGLRHKKTYTRYSIVVCADCRTIISEDQNSLEEVDNNYLHEYDENRICIECEYENDCVHEGERTTRESVLGQNYIERTETTHTQQGKLRTWVVCNDCNETFSDETTEEEVTRKEAHRFGRGEARCQLCGYECIHEYDPKVTAQASCTQDGQIVYTCSKCESSYTESIIRSGHKYVAGASKAATCTKAGYDLQQCINDGCDSEIKTVIPATGHDYNTEGICVVEGCEAKVVKVVANVSADNIDTTKVSEAVTDQVATTVSEIKEAVESHEVFYEVHADEPETVTVQTMTITLNEISLTTETTESSDPGSETETVVPEKLVFEVTPMGENGKEIHNFTYPLTFHLPIPSSVTAARAKVSHDGKYMGTYDILGNDTDKFIEISSRNFSEYEVEPTNIDSEIDLSENSYTITEPGEYIVKAYTGANTLTIKADAIVELQDVNITAAEGASAISIESGNVELSASTDSTLKGGTGGAGIYVAEGASLTIVKDDGKITAIGNGGSNDSSGAAGIGGSGISGKGSSGAITIDDATVVAKGYGLHGSGIGSGSGKVVGEIKIINGANVTAYGGYYADGEGTKLQTDWGKFDPEGGAGIGGGGKTGSTLAAIIIDDSVVEAYGGSKAAGIGANFWCSCSNITISGNSTVTAQGGSSSAGIGTSRLSRESMVSANITINGGSITATGGAYGAGIGSGYNSYGLGDDAPSSGLLETKITINGGRITATGGRGGAGIGGGYKSDNVDIDINGGSINAKRGGLEEDGPTATTPDKTAACAIGPGADGSGNFNNSPDVKISSNATVTATAEYGGKPAIFGWDNAVADEQDNIEVIVRFDPVARIGTTNYPDFESALAAACKMTGDIRIDILADSKHKAEMIDDYYYLQGNLTIGSIDGENHTVTIESRITYDNNDKPKDNWISICIMDNGASLTIEDNVDIDHWEIVANGFSTTGENMYINGTMKALSLKQWTSNGTITVSETGKVWLGYGDGQFDMAYGNGTVNVTGSGDKINAQFRAGYSTTRSTGNGNTLNLKDTYFEGGSWFNVDGSNGTFNVNNSLLKVSGGDGLTVASTGNKINLTNGSELNVATITLGAGNEISVDATSKITATTISGAGTICIYAGARADGAEVTEIEGNLSGFTGLIKVMDNEQLGAFVEDDTVVLRKVVAKIGDVKYKSLQDAVGKANSDDTIILVDDVKLTEQFNFEKSVTVDGRGQYKIVANNSDWSNVSGYKHLISVNTDNVTLKNITLDSNEQAWGVNLYTAENVVFENVTIKNLVEDAYNDLTVNGSTLKVRGSLTARSVDLDLGSGVTNDSGITIDEDADIDVDVFILANEKATITGPEGLNVISHQEGFVVVYVDGVYKIVDADTTYTVTFNANGGTGSMEQQTFTVNVEGKLKANTFTRSGYVFAGWSTTNDGPVEYANSASFFPVKDVTLYAQWKKLYTVTFDPNGGEGERTTQTFTEGETKALNENKFTRKNFYFTGWKDDEGNFYTNKQAVKFDKNTTLYAQWARVPSTTSYTVQYNANGGTGSVYLQAFTSSMTFSLRMNEFVREGYTFAGWNTKADGTGDAYAEGASFSGSIKKSIVLYAQWKLDVPEFPAVRPEYKIEVEGQEGKITRLNDTSIIYDKMYIRWSIGFETSNTTFAMIAMLDVTWVEGQEGIVGTFTIPVIETNGIISGVCYMVTTDDRANELTVGEAAENIYGILIV